jgi:hypothetical protein
LSRAGVGNLPVGEALLRAGADTEAASPAEGATPLMVIANAHPPN